MESTGDGGFLSGQPMSRQPAMSLWGVPMVVDVNLAAGTAIVGAFRRAAAIYRKGTIQVEMGAASRRLLHQEPGGHPRRAARGPRGLQAAGVRQGHWPGPGVMVISHSASSRLAGPPSSPDGVQ